MFVVSLLAIVVLTVVVPLGQARVGSVAADNGKQVVSLSSIQEDMLALEAKYQQDMDTMRKLIQEMRVEFQQELSKVVVVAVASAKKNTENNNNLAWKEGYQQLTAENQELREMIQGLQRGADTVLPKKEDTVLHKKATNPRALAATIYVKNTRFKRFRVNLTAELGGMKAQISELFSSIANISSVQGIQSSIINATAAIVDATAAIANATAAKTVCIHPASDSNNLMFHGCNVHIRNGWNTTNSTNGFGNLILGYGEGDVTALTRTGSHNVIIGPRHQYSSWGSIVSGSDNTVSGESSSIIAGHKNRVSGEESAIIAGVSNRVTGMLSSVVAGSDNRVDGYGAAAVGGIANRALAAFAVATAGKLNHVYGYGAASVGGENNAIETDDFDYFNDGNAYSVTVGGAKNTITGLRSVAVAGSSNLVTGNEAAGVGGVFNDIAGLDSVAVSGSKNNITGLEAAGVAGAVNVVQGNASASLAGYGKVVVGAYTAGVGPTP